MFEKKVIAFDLHGTLAESRIKVDHEMSSLLLRLLGKGDVAVISGSTFRQLEAELLVSLDGADALLGRLYLLPSEGGEMYRWDGDWSSVYVVKLSPEEREQIREAFRSIYNEVDFLPRLAPDNALLDRGSQMVFAALGLDAPLEAKKTWDPDARKRLLLKEMLTERLPDFEITVGGNASLTVGRRGINKSYGISRLLNYLGGEKSDVLYIGDGFFGGGDDYPVLGGGISCIEVSGPKDAKKLMKDLLGWMEGREAKVAVAGNFFPFHDGHASHFEEARKLGSHLVAIVGSDDYLRRKGKRIFLSLENRKKQLMAWTDEVVEVVDTDGTCARTLAMVKPDIFAKGEGYGPDTMPKKELDVCRGIGCKVIYGVGALLDSSSKILKEVTTPWQ